MNNSTNTAELIQGIQSQLLPSDILFRPEAAHLVETPTPLTFSILSGLYSFKGSLGQAYQALDLPISEYKIEKYVRYICSRMYLDLRCEEEFLHKALGMEYAIVGSEPKLQKRKNVIANFPKTIKNIISNSFILTQAATHVEFATMMLSTLQKVTLPALPTDSDSAKQLLMQELEKFYTEYSAIFRLAYIEGLLASSMNKELLTQLSSSNSEKDLYVASVKIWNSTQVSSDDVLAKFGNRSFTDFEFSAPRWYEEASVIKTLLDKRNDSQATKETTPELAHNPRLTQLQDIIILKDNLRFAILNRVNSIRQVLLKLGDLLELGQNIFYLSLEDFNNTDLTQLKVKATENKTQFEIYKASYVPELITKEAQLSPQNQTSARVLACTPVSAGKVEGKLSVVRSAMDEPLAGSILVLPTAGPEFTHLYNKAVGIIFLTGGVLSHGSIISREMHIPAVVAQLSEIQLQSNNVISLNATSGTITF